MNGNSGQHCSLGMLVLSLSATITNPMFMTRLLELHDAGQLSFIGRLAGLSDRRRHFAVPQEPLIPPTMSMLWWRHRETANGGA